MFVLPLCIKTSFVHSSVKYLADFLSKGDVVVLNRTKVISARIHGRKIPTGAKTEIFLCEKLDKNTWRALVKPSRRLHEGNRVQLTGSDISVNILKREKGAFRIVRFDIAGEMTDEMIESIGEVPLPPYIKRKPEDEDQRRYQTVFAKIPGAVAAPTAGLHLTSEIFEHLQSKGILIADILLHVGPGTFAPLSDDMERHKMHSEYYEVYEETVKIISKAKTEGRKIIAVGTTSVRSLESSFNERGEFFKSSGWTDIFIYPPYNFRVVNGMLTNFHLPKSTLICLVAAMAGRERILKSYELALETGYRFASYGDCMLILP